METIFRNSKLVAVALLLGAAIMFFAEKNNKESKNITVRSGFLIGIFQALALVPGMSRSGMTISGGLFSGLNRETATRFSFLLSLPIIFGSGMKKFFELSQGDYFFTPELGISFIFSFFVGLLCIHYLLRFLRNHTLNIFVWYRVILALIILFFI
jgi:undecaprenyl-diphosphatase